MAAGLLRAASSLFGGAFGGAAQSADCVKDALRGEGWDAAFQSAIDEAKPRFRQCTRCGCWVCPDVCWNTSRNLCESCAALTRRFALFAPGPTRYCLDRGLYRFTAISRRLEFFEVGR